MFGLLRNQSRSAAGAIGYVTVGTLMVIWAGLWYYYFLMPQLNPPPWQKFVCVGTIMSGFAIGSIGLLFGLIGRGAKGADTTVGIAAGATEVPVVSVGADTAGVVSTPVVSVAAPVTTAPVTAAPVNYAKR